MKCLSRREAAHKSAVWLAVCFLFALASCSAENLKDSHDFTLQSVAGEVSLHDFSGKVVLLFFGYTHCPDICPATMNNVATALGQLNDVEKKMVQVLFVTVDPERDSVEYLKKYVGFFHAGIIGLSGSAEQIKKAASAYGVEFYKLDGNNTGGYEVIHTSRLFLINRDGVMSDIMSYKTAPEDISTALRKWFNEKG